MSCSTETTFTPSASSAARPEVFATSRKAPTRLQLPVEQQRQLEIVVDASYPFEACGVMIGRAGRRTVTVENVFHARNLNVERARDRFLLDPEDHLAADREARRRGLEIVGFWHSHPDHPARPSVTDLEAAWEGYSYVILSVGREGVVDVRSWILDGAAFVRIVAQCAVTQVRLLQQNLRTDAFEAHHPRVAELRAEVAAQMEAAAELSVPLKVDVGVGMNWDEAH